MTKPSIEIGNIYGRLTVLSLHSKRIYNKIFMCKCECGEVCTIEGWALNSGRTKSCGCLQREVTSKRATKHGLLKNGEGTKLYAVWRNMKTRCLNKNSGAYHNYGGRGITICQEWIDSFETFATWANKNEWNDSLEIDRKENNGNYCPENCRFVTLSVNQFNTRRSLNSLAKKCRDAGVEYPLVLDRLREGWDIERAMTTPKRKRRKNGENI